MKTFAQFIEEKTIGKMFGLTGGSKRGGVRQGPAKMLASGQVKAVNPSKPVGMIVPGEIYGKRKPSSIIGK